MKTAPQFVPHAVANGHVALLVATRKGAFILKTDSARRAWKTTGPMFFGHIVHHMLLDPRPGPGPKNARTLLVAARTGHLGPSVFRSRDFGRSWKEAAKPPAFPKLPQGQTEQNTPNVQKGRVVDHTFWLSPGHASEPGVW